MAEIILPPEENEETPQTPELNIDKPTGNSKVITIEFEAKKTNKVSTKDTNQQLYTTDTDAWFEFKETSLEGANGTYSVVFRNRHDGSIFQRTGDVVSGVAYYKIPHQEIRHAGAWRGQVVYTLSNGDTTAREFDYDVKGHILDGKDVREIIVEDFETLMSQLRSMKDSAESELASLVNTANQNETDRQAFFDDLVEDIDELQANYQELLDTGVLQTNINAKLEALEEEYAPKLTEVTAQLAQKANKIDVFLKENGININDFDEETRQTFLEGQGIDVDYVLGAGNVTNENIAEKTIQPDKVAFVTTGANLFDKSRRIPGILIYSNGSSGANSSFSVSNNIPVSSGDTFSGSPVYSANWYDKDGDFIKQDGFLGGEEIDAKFTAPEGTHSLKIVTSYSGAYTMVNKGDTLLPLEPYKLFLNEAFGVHNEIEKLSTSVDEWVGFLTESGQFWEVV